MDCEVKLFTFLPTTIVPKIRTMLLYIVGIHIGYKKCICNKNKIIRYYTESSHKSFPCNWAFGLIKKKKKNRRKLEYVFLPE